MNNSSFSKRRSIVNLNRSVRAGDLTAYAAKEELQDSPVGTPDHRQNQNDIDLETPTPTLSRAERQNNLKSLHEIMSKSFDPKRAFNYNFINIMNTFINNDKGNVDFKLIALSLDAGTRVWTSKVDVVFRNTQKVSNSLAMATGDEKAGQGMDFDDDDEMMFENTFLRNEKKKAAKKRKKVAPTIVSNPETINGKLEMNIAVDPLFHHFSASFDVGNVNSLLMANLACDPVGTLLLDSSEKLNFAGHPPLPNSMVDLADFQIKGLENGCRLTVCPPMGSFDITNFNFNDRDASIEHLLAMNGNTGKGDTVFPAATDDGGGFEFDLDAPVDDLELNDDDSLNYGDHNNNDHHDDDHHNLGKEGGGKEGDGAGGENDLLHRLNSQLDVSLLEANLMDILPANKNEFFNKNFLRQVFRKVPFFKGAGRSLLNGPDLGDPAGADKTLAAAAKPKPRTRPTFEENAYDASDDVLEALFEKPTKEVKDSLVFGVPTLNRWANASELFHMKDDYGFDTHLLKRPFTKPNTYFNDLQREKMAAAAAAAAKAGQSGGGIAAGFDDDDDAFGDGGGGVDIFPDDDDGVGGNGDAGEYNYEPPNDFNIADDYQRPLAGISSEDGSGLPGHVDALDIDYCRVAKKVDMKRVKRGMWDVIRETATTTEPFPNDPSQPSSQASTANGPGLTFSSLRQILPSHINANLNENLSLHTSFVALLHLCNDKNLVLAPGEHTQDHSDFVIYKPIESLPKPN